MSAKLTRCIRLLTAFQQRGQLANRDVRELLDCDEQTAARDLRSLMDAGVPLDVNGTGASRHYVLDPGWRRSGIGFSMGDAMSLHFGRKLLSFLEGTVFPEWMDELREKLDVGAEPQTLDRRGRLARKLVYLSEPFRPYAAHDATLDVILRGLLEERELVATYRSRRGDREYLLEPLALVIYRRALYLLASSNAHRHTLRLPVERFVSARLGEAFTYPLDFDPEQVLQDTFGIFDDGAEASEVRLRFTPEVADLVQSRVWHPSQRFEEGPDGAVDLVMEASGPELARLTLEWGAQVRALEPFWLRERVQQEMKAALAVYPESSVDVLHRWLDGQAFDVGEVLTQLAHHAEQFDAILSEAVERNSDKMDDCWEPISDLLYASDHPAAADVPLLIWQTLLEFDPVFPERLANPRLLPELSGNDRSVFRTMVDYAVSEVDHAPSAWLLRSDLFEADEVETRLVDSITPTRRRTVHVDNALALEVALNRLDGMARVRALGAITGVGETLRRQVSVAWPEAVPLDDQEVELLFAQAVRFLTPIEHPNAVRAAVRLCAQAPAGVVDAEVETLLHALWAAEGTAILPHLVEMCIDADLHDSKAAVAAGLASVEPTQAALAALRRGAGPERAPALWAHLTAADLKTQLAELLRLLDD